MAKSGNKVEYDDAGFWVFCKEYTNRWGKLMVASEYGYQFWRFRVNKRKKA